VYSITKKNSKQYLKQALAIGLVSFGVFVWFSTTGIYGGDSGDLVSAAAQCGVPHPPGYALYTLLGCFLNMIPLITPSWKLTLLSSIPHALVLAMLYGVVSVITSMPGIGLATVILLAANYLFFLYSVTPEVFAGLSLFLMGISIALFTWMYIKKIRHWYVLCFLTGLSLSHHHVILFLAPAALVMIWKTHVYKTLSRMHIIFGILWMFVGLLPYVYVIIAARFGHAVVLWNNPNSFSRFMRLVTRADYGTFQSGAVYGAGLTERLLQFKAYGQLLLYDLRIIGVILAIIGWICLYKKQWIVWIYTTIAYLLLGPFFFFYASFPLMNRFTLGTYERFMLPGYLILYLYLGVGLSVVYQYVTHTIGRMFSSRTIYTIWEYGIILFVVSYVSSQIYITINRFWGIQHDQTANNLGIDILSTLPPRTILIMGRDTPLFTTQYMRYALNMRPDVKVIHATRLTTEDYQDVLSRAFSDIRFPQVYDRKVSSFISANISHSPIYANQEYPVEKGYVWIHEGLLYKLASSSASFSIEKFVEDNNRLWNSYHNPWNGILSRYTHLMLADVLGVYAGARVETGKVLLKLNRFDDAISYADAAISYHSESITSDAYMIKALAFKEKNNCDEAQKNIKLSQTFSLVAEPESYLLLSEIYADCYKNEKKAQEFKAIYDALTRKAAIPLETKER